jgi:mannonate dehydratase
MDGCMNVSNAPGLGCDLNEETAKKRPYRRVYLAPARGKDGSVKDW